MYLYRLGNILIVLGVSVWVVFFLMKVTQTYDGPATPFLAVHLLCVVPGAFLAGRGWTRRLMEMFGRGVEQSELRDR